MNIESGGPRHDEAGASTTNSLGIREGLYPERAIFIDSLGQPPSFEEVASDPSRQNTIELWGIGPDTDGAPMRVDVVKTESDMAADLTGFLQDFIARSSSEDMGFIEGSDTIPEDLPRMREFAQDVIDITSYIGEKERILASKAIAEGWKKHLRQTPDSRIFALAPISTDVKGEPGSDRFIRDEIFAHFTPEEGKEFEGRLLAREIHDMPDTMQANDRVVMVDDWIVTGAQMTTATRVIATSKPAALALTEIHLVTSSADRLVNGIDLPLLIEGGAQTINLPVRAPYTSRPIYSASPTILGHTPNARETGSHSATDVGFRGPINVIAFFMATQTDPGDTTMGAVSIISPY